VLHGPSLRDRFSDEDWEIWRAMADLARAGRVRRLGVSNVGLGHLEALWASDEIPKPTFVQNRCYARTGWDAAVRRFCRAHNLVYQGFSLLTANQRELASPTVTRIARRVGRTPAEVIFAMQVGMIPLTGTSDPAHMRQDLSVSTAFTLDDDEIAALERIG
jgi:diketogulonate reductase-like aldo/keto reductase